MRPTIALHAALALAALALPAHAQVHAFGGTAPRMAATRGFFDPQKQELKGMLCVQYGQPSWKAEYEQQLDSLKGKSVRLGKDFWTTFNTSMALDVGGTKVAAGSYYLGLNRDAEGTFHLVFLRAEAADKAGFTPFATDDWKPDFTAPLKHAATESPVEKLTIEVNGDEKDVAQMTLSITWGTHALSVPVKAQLAS